MDCGQLCKTVNITILVSQSVSHCSLSVLNIRGMYVQHCVCVLFWLCVCAVVTLLSGELSSDGTVPTVPSGENRAERGETAFSEMRTCLEYLKMALFSPFLPSLSTSRFFPFSVSPPPLSTPISYFPLFSLPFHCFLPLP